MTPKKGNTKTNTKEESKMANTPKHIKREEQDLPPVESAMPYATLKLLQTTSPELDEDSDKYIKGAVAGMFVVTDGTDTELFSGEKGTRFIPLLVRKVYTEWVPRGKGGGFVAAYASREEAEANFTNGNELNVSIEYLVVSPDVEKNKTQYPFLLQFNSPTKMSAARELQKFIKSYQTMHGVTYLLKSKKQANKAGQKFFNYTVATVGWTDEGVYKLLDKVKGEKEQLFLPVVDTPAF